MRTFTDQVENHRAGTAFPLAVKSLPIHRKLHPFYPLDTYSNMLALHISTCEFRALLASSLTSARITGHPPEHEFRLSLRTSMPSDEPQAAASPPPPKVFVWWRDYPLFIFFIVVWVVPMFWMGATKQRLSHVWANKINKEYVNLREIKLPYKVDKRQATLDDVVRLPREITHLHNASCLFTRSVNNWSTNHLQGSFDGQRWFTLRDEQYSPAKPFGHRARVDRMLSDIGAWRKRSSVYRRQADEFCDWYRNQYAKLNPTSEPLKAVRLVGILYRVGDPYIAEPRGRWVKRIPEEVDDRRPYVIHTKMYRDPPGASMKKSTTELIAVEPQGRIEACCDEF